MSWFSVSNIKSQPDEEPGSKALDTKHNVIDIFSVSCEGCPQPDQRGARKPVM